MKKDDGKLTAKKRVTKKPIIEKAIDQSENTPPQLKAGEFLPGLRKKDVTYQRRNLLLLIMGLTDKELVLLTERMLAVSKATIDGHRDYPNPVCIEGIDFYQIDFFEISASINTYLQPTIITDQDTIFAYKDLIIE